MVELNRGGLIFPAELYTIVSVLSVISSHKGDIENAKYYAEVAEGSATAKTNTLWNPRKKSYGLVEQRNTRLDKLVKKALKFKRTKT